MSWVGGRWTERSRDCAGGRGRASSIWGVSKRVFIVEVLGGGEGLKQTVKKKNFGERLQQCAVESLGGGGSGGGIVPEALYSTCKKAKSKNRRPWYKVSKTHKYVIKIQKKGRRQKGGTDQGVKLPTLTLSGEGKRITKTVHSNTNKRDKG